MIQVLMFLMMVIFLALFFDIEKERIRVIAFEGAPLEIVIRNNRPILYKFDKAIQDDVWKAWKQHLKDLSEMIQADKSLSHLEFQKKRELEQFWNLEVFKAKRQIRDKVASET